MEGGNGCGKSSILRLVLEIADKGKKKQAELEGGKKGHIRYGRGTVVSGLKISYVPQSAEFLKGSLREFAEEWGWMRRCFWLCLESLIFQRAV